MIPVSTSVPVIEDAGAGAHAHVGACARAAVRSPRAASGEIEADREDGRGHRHDRAVDLHLHRRVAERQQQLRRGLGRDRLPGVEDRARDQLLAVAVDEADVDGPVGTSSELDRLGPAPACATSRRRARRVGRVVAWRRSSVVRPRRLLVAAAEEVQRDHDGRPARPPIIAHGGISGPALGGALALAAERRDRAAARGRRGARSGACTRRRACGCRARGSRRRCAGSS